MYKISEVSQHNCRRNQPEINFFPNKHISLYRLEFPPWNFTKRSLPLCLVNVKYCEILIFFYIKRVYILVYDALIRRIRLGPLRRSHRREGIH